MFAHNLYINPAQSFKYFHKKHDRELDKGLCVLEPWQQFIQSLVHDGLESYPQYMDYTYSRAYWTHTKEVRDSIDFYEPCKQVIYCFCD
jgi:hypothetical protein